MPTEGLSEDELFDGAVGDQPETEVQAGIVEQVKAEPEKTGDDGAGLTSEKTAVDDNAAMVPSWRVREINDEKRALADRVAAFEAEKLQWQRQQPQPEAKAEKPAKPDPLLDPEGYDAAVREGIRQEMLAERREDSLQRARETNAEAFDKAHNEAMRLKAALDPEFLGLSQKMQASRDPGKTLLEWHRENKTRQEIGGDLNAYKQRIRDEALKDPEYRKVAIAAWQADAQPQSNGRPRVELPPSLNGASRSNAALRSANADASDDELWDAATA